MVASLDARTTKELPTKAEYGGGLSRSGNECSHAPSKRLEKSCRDNEVEVSGGNVLEHDDWEIGGGFEIMAATMTTNLLLRRAARSGVVVGNFPAPQ